MALVFFFPSFFFWKCVFISWVIADYFKRSQLNRLKCRLVSVSPASFLPQGTFTVPYINSYCKKQWTTSASCLTECAVTTLCPLPLSGEKWRLLLVWNRQWGGRGRGGEKGRRAPEEVSVSGDRRVKPDLNPFDFISGCNVFFIIDEEKKNEWNGCLSQWRWSVKIYVYSRTILYEKYSSFTPFASTVSLSRTITPIFFIIVNVPIQQCKNTSLHHKITSELSIISKM